ncbi:alpha/beta fold hydrolase [Shimia sp.]|uniref:alpha/beta hydrolase n=1 Tax=Shimia sp. TaxID=1954381 RepID=UPI003298A42E
MRTFGQFLGRSVIFTSVLAAALWTWGPYEKISLKPAFLAGMMGQDIDAYLADQESVYDDITPGVKKRVIWHGQAGQKTETVIVYVHGFSATSEEIRPVPDQVAEALGANLIYTRLEGHGRSGDALAKASVQGWADDVAEAMEIARRSGDKVIIIATSTGATLVSAMLDQPNVMRDLHGMILISPNFGINNPLARLLTLPAARDWVPLVGGRERNWEPQNDAHGRYWTTSYPAEALLQMAALVEYAASKDYSGVKVPTLVMFSDADQVVLANKTREVLSGWGGPLTVEEIEPKPGIDPNAHLIVGDILSASVTPEAVDIFIKFIKGIY